MPQRCLRFSTAETDPRLCKKNHNYFAAQIKEMVHNRKVAAREEVRRLSMSLYNLERVHRNFLREKPAAPALLSSDLTGTDRLVTTLRDALAARAAWEKQQQARKKQQAQMQEQALEQQAQEPEQQPEAQAEEQAEATQEQAGTTGGNEQEAEEPEYVPEKGAVADYVAKLLSPAIKEALEKAGNASSNAFRKMLLDDLNRIIETGNVFEGSLSMDGQKTLEEYRSNTSAGKRIGLRKALLKSVSDTLAADRTNFTGAAGTPIPQNISTLVIADAAGKALAEPNRTILSFVFASSITPAAIEYWARAMRP